MGDVARLFACRVLASLCLFLVCAIAVVSLVRAACASPAQDCLLSKQCIPAFPASSPYVTAVGGTQIENGVSSGAKR